MLQLAMEADSFEEFLMVGDRPEDEQAAAAAGIPFTWAEEWRCG
jgi:D-glycero-D-manno-heptose 1,7-bisphosphate phosphatase